MTVHITATYARRDEPQWLIDDLRSNLAWVDDFLEMQTPTEGPWPHEGRQLAERRRLLLERGATWTLWVDPDERLEDTAAELVRAAVERAERHSPRVLFGFPLREMWTPTQWRRDGVWGNKLPRWRLFKLRAGQTFRDKPIHCAVRPNGLSRRVLPVNLYHLKNIEPSNRVARAQAYEAADRGHRERRVWSWLYDERGLELAEIEPGREFSPPYTRPYYFNMPGGGGQDGTEAGRSH